MGCRTTRIPAASRAGIVAQARLIARSTSSTSRRNVSQAWTSRSRRASAAGSRQCGPLYPSPPLAGQEGHPEGAAGAEARPPARRPAAPSRPGTGCRSRFAIRPRRGAGRRAARRSSRPRIAGQPERPGCPRSPQRIPASPPAIAAVVSVSLPKRTARVDRGLVARSAASNASHADQNESATWPPPGPPAPRPGGPPGRPPAGPSPTCASERVARAGQRGAGLLGMPRGAVPRAGRRGRRRREAAARRGSRAEAVLAQRTRVASSRPRPASATGRIRMREPLPSPSGRTLPASSAGTPALERVDGGPGGVADVEAPVAVGRVGTRSIPAPDPAALVGRVEPDRRRVDRRRPGPRANRAGPA